MGSTEAESTPSPNPKAIDSLSLSIWPPSQRTRDAVTSRLIETLSSESVLSKRYGTLPIHEASDLARKLEEEAFQAAGAGGLKPQDDGIETLQVYSKEISKRMLDAVKSRSVPDSDIVTAPVPALDAVDDVVEGKKEEEVIVPADDVVEEAATGSPKGAEE